MDLFEANDAKFRSNLESLRTPLSLPPSLRHAQVLSMEDADCSSQDDLPPTLRCLSVGTRSLSTCAIDDDDNDDDKDDASTVSSVSLDDFQDADSQSSATTGPAKRCIFASYWNKKGGRPKSPLLSTCEEDQPLPPSSSNSAEEEKDRAAKAKQQSYEDLLDESAASAETPTRRSSAGSAAGNRRRLFDSRTVSQYQSVPSLLLQTRMEPLRKTQSERAVATKRPSCLRPSRFSGSSRRTSTSSTASTSTASSSSSSTQQRRSSETTVVSFSDHVQVKYLKADTEKFAAPGWSKYFM